MYYLDHAATTPMHPEVAAVMLEVMQGPGGNPSSMHAFGRAAKQLLSRSRDGMAAALHCRPNELVFTSGGTESDNLAIIGAARALRHEGKNHIITSAAEHHAVLHTCEWLSKQGYEVTVLPVDATGRVSPEDVRNAITSRTGLMTIMHGNNEVGTMQPIQELGEIARAHGITFHVDAVQSLGSFPYDLHDLPVDLVSFSAHKINGPAGVGLLYIKQGTPIEPLALGGSQERKRRAGTENVAGIAGFARALDLCVSNRSSRRQELDVLREVWIEQLTARLDKDAIMVNGHGEERLPHIANLSFLGVDTETMLMNLDLSGIAASSGSACTSGSLERSHVLRAMKLPDEHLNTAIRFSFGLGNTREQLDEAAQIVATIVQRIRNNS
ncbi:cysteine desulfurase family protein [Paenibacillus sp. GCM10023252]|uniref:cysteine desulfurase family protein n=1 Tax=Paenibacillus sp. GCM10023252 TaxID=3252649 RepID=UPI00360F03B5